MERHYAYFGSLEEVVPQTFRRLSGTAHWVQETAEHLIARDGRSWLMPNLHHYQETLLRCEVGKDKKPPR